MNADFYDRLSPKYHLLYEDWPAAVAQQGRALSDLLLGAGLVIGEPIHDAACGIGTQTLGLLAEGHRVSASDLSAASVDRLNAEMSARGFYAPTWVDDMRTLERVSDASLAALMACDNSLPHLLTDGEILRALGAWRRCLRRGGVLVISVRDYAVIPRVDPDVRPYGLRRDGDRRFLAVQTWEWHGDQYDLRLYLTVEHADGRCETEVLVSRYYAVTVRRLLELLGEAGFEGACREDGVLFQPVIVARKV